MDLTNWAGNIRYGAAEYVEPNTVEEAQQLIASTHIVKPLGTRHCFNRIADTAGTLVSTGCLNHVVSLDTERLRVTVEGGIAYGPLSDFLFARGYGLKNLASLPHISVAGACATGTHGSGVGNQNLSSAVVAMEVIVADGSLVTFSRETNAELLRAAVIHLGGFGLVSKLTLDVVPTFDVAQVFYENLSDSAFLENPFELLSSGYSVSIFTHWDNSDTNLVLLKHLVEEGVTPLFPEILFGATPARAQRHMIADMHAMNCTEQMGVPGPWHHRLPHFKMEFTPSSGAELQTEYFVPLELAKEALCAMSKLGTKISPLLLISEIRTIASDDLPMSPAFERHSLGIHFTWKPMIDQVTVLLPEIAEALAPFDARPHYGKLFSVPSLSSKEISRLQELGSFLARYDANGKFRNLFMDQLGL
jgi:xylitol oxidase